jgi:predicted nucleic acid-binding protein
VRLFVADTGPLLHLHQIGATTLLPLLGEVWTTPAVAQELQRHAPELCGAAWPSWLRVAEVSAAAQVQAHQWRQAGLLHAGQSIHVARGGQVAPLSGSGSI